MAAPVVSTQKLVDTTHRVVYKFTNLSDGTAQETGVTKVDLTTLNGYQTGASLVLTQASCVISSGVVQIIWGGVVDSLAVTLTGSWHHVYNGTLAAPITNDATTPDAENYVKFTTLGFPANSGYTICLEFKKVGFPY